MRMLRHIIVLSCVMVMIMLTSCAHKELCYDHSHVLEVDVVFDWSNAPDASPRSMSLYLFPEEGGRPVRYDLVGHKGGRIRLNSGTYNIICLNSDTENIDVHDDLAYESLRVTTKEADALRGMYAMASIIKAQKADGERLSDSPENVWSAYAESVLFSASDPSVTLFPEPDVMNCTVEIRNAENLKWIENVYGTLSGMADGFFPQKDVLCEELATIAFDCSYDPENKTVTGGLSSFGHCPSYPNTHVLAIYVTLADGSMWEYTFDVTEQVHESADPYNIKIVLDNLPIPKPVVNGGGFKPTIDEWGNIDININM